MYDIVYFLSTFLLLAYLYIIYTIIRGWNSVPYFEIKAETKLPHSISVVICCRNESKHLPALIEALKVQSFKHFELVWVNDHSTDETLEIMQSSIDSFEHVQIVNADGKGKKKALKEGIFATSGDLIVTTDADCIPGEHWLESISSFQQQCPADLLICPVKMPQGHTLFTRLQSLEFATLVGTGMGAAGAGMPILCNAANMAFTKKAWMQSKGDLHEEEMSGDDVFLLLSVKKRNGKVAVLKSREAMVVTGYKKSLRSFINQRRRWASKSSKYTDCQILTVGAVVAAISFILFLLFLFSFFFTQLWLVFLPVFLIKFITDYLFLREIRPCFLFNLKVIDVLMLSLVYPLYVTTVGISSLIWKRKSW
ncbi:MAG: glycosyltransferase [Paludibacter sp.]|nr:glycosyltransferase [Paludibacter sp.]